MSISSRWTGEDKYFKEDNKTFCILPFVHIHVDTDGIYKPCCVTPRNQFGNNSDMGNVSEESVEDIFNSDKMKQLRLDLLNGVKRPEICDACYQGDAGGFSTYRTGQNENLNRFIEPSVEAMQPDGYLEPSIKSWDIRYSNLCNLKCRTCGDPYSTTWSREESLLHGTEYKELKAWEDGLDPLSNQYTEVTNIYFAGGEPMIMPEHYATLTRIIELGRANEIQLYYNTNMTKLDYNKHHMPDYWKEFKEVRLGLSLDSFGERANYIRNGAVRWNKIEANIKILKNYENLDYWMQPTISLMNVFTITEMHRYFIENELITDINKILFNILYTPHHWSVKILPTNIKQEAKNKILKHMIWMEDNGASQLAIEQFNNLANYLDEGFDSETEKREIGNFVYRTNQLDAIRNESFPDTFPEYKEWWEEISKGTIKFVNIT
jgi:MoaA/NifB/PqqE/SkfB family radical SAM enzyme